MTRARWAVLRSTATILRRESLGLLRSRKGFWIAVATVAATGLIPLWHWPAEDSPFPSASARAAFETYRRVTKGLLLIFVPLVAFTSLTGERKRNTMVMLLSTPLRPAGIILGKFLSTAGFFLLLVALTFPMAAVLYLLGGFEAGEFAWALVEVACIIFLLSIFGLDVCSPQAIPRWARFLFSLLSVVSLFPWAVINKLSVFSLVALILGMSSLLPLIWAVATGQAFETVMVKPSRALRLYQTRSRAWPVSAILAAALHGIPDGWNPVQVVSVLSNFGRSGHYKLFLTLFLIMGLTLMVLFTSLTGPSRVLVVVAVLFPVISTAISPALACNLVKSDREQETLELLRSTPLGSPAILMGKLSAALLVPAVILITGGTLFVLSLPLILGTLEFPGVEWILTALFSPFALAVASLEAATAGVLGAALSRTTQQAMILSYLIALCSLIALPFLTGWLGLSPLTTLLATTSFFGLRLFTGGDLVVSVVVGLTLAHIHFLIALAVFEKKWMQER